MCLQIQNSRHLAILSCGDSGRWRRSIVSARCFSSCRSDHMSGVWMHIAAISSTCRLGTWTSRLVGSHFRLPSLAYRQPAGLRQHHMLLWTGIFGRAYEKRRCQYERVRFLLWHWRQPSTRNTRVPLLAERSMPIHRLTYHEVESTRKSGLSTTSSPP